MHARPVAVRAIGMRKPIHVGLAEGVLEIDRAQPVEDHQPDIGLGRPGELAHQRPRDRRHRHVGEVGIGEAQNAGRDLVFAEIVAIGEIAQLGQGMGKARYGRFRDPCAPRDVGIAEELLVQLEGAQDGDAPGQCRVEPRITRVDGTLNHLFPGPAAPILVVHRPCHRVPLVASIVAVKNGSYSLFPLY